MMKDSDRIEQLERMVAELSRQIASVPVRLGDGGGASGGTETLGCYLHRVSGALTLNFAALFGEGFIVGEETPCPLIYPDPAVFTGPPGADSVVPGPPGADGDTVSEGYCIDIVDLGGSVAQIFFDPITDNPAIPATDKDLTKQQFFVHFAGASAATDGKWKTAETYDAAAAGQLFLNLAGTWKWHTITGYDDTKTQLLGHINGVFHAKTVAEWLNLLPGYVAGNDQSIGHDAAGATEWQDDGDCA